MKVGKNCRVALNYSIKLADGNVVESNPEDEPLVFVTGREEVIPALEQGIEGMEAGEVKTFEVGPDEAFGHRDPEAIQTVPRQEIDDRGIQLEQGMILRLRDQEGNPMLATVISLDQEEVIFDFNHPLAGARLEFEVELIEVSEAPLS